jgi:accessory gene regulator protein AgrB
MNMKMVIRRLAAFYPDDTLAEAKIRYAWEIIRSETVKCVIMLFVFLMLNRIGLYVAGLVFLFPLRAVSGGFHFQHESSCLIFSLLTMVLGLIVFPEHIPCGAWIYAVLAVVLVVIGIVSPVASPNKPIVSIKKWKHMKSLSILISVIESIAISILVIISSDYGYPLFWIMTIQGLQLVPGAMIYGFGKKTIKGNN